MTLGNVGMQDASLTAPEYFHVETKARYPSEYEYEFVAIVEWTDRHGTLWGKDEYTGLWFKREELVKEE